MAAVVSRHLVERTNILVNSYPLEDERPEVFRTEDRTPLDARLFFELASRYVALENAMTLQDDLDPGSSTPTPQPEECSVGRFMARVVSAKMVEAEVHSGALEQMLRYRFFLGQDESGQWICVADKVDDGAWVRIENEWQGENEGQALTRAQNAILTGLGERPEYSEERY